MPLVVGCVFGYLRCRPHSMICKHNRWVVSFVSHPLGTTGEHGYDSASTWEWSQWGTVLVSNDQLEEVELRRKDVCI